MSSAITPTRPTSAVPSREVARSNSTSVTEKEKMNKYSPRDLPQCGLSGFDADKEDSESSNNDSSQRKRDANSPVLSEYERKSLQEPTTNQMAFAETITSKSGNGSSRIHPFTSKLPQYVKFSK